MGTKEQQEMIGKQGVDQYFIEFFEYALDMGKQVNAKKKLDQKDHSQQVSFEKQFENKISCSREEFKFD